MDLIKNVLNIVLDILDIFGDISGICVASATFIAIPVAGWWSYMRFVRNRQTYPRARVEHYISHRPFAQDKVLLRVVVIITNLGEILLSLTSLETRIQQVLPPSCQVLAFVSNGRSPVRKGETEVDWPRVDSHELSLKGEICEVEPGESQEFHHDFVVGAEIRTVAVYTHIMNEKKRARQLGWEATTLYDLPASEGNSS